jgi:hypothetical protein
MTVRCRKIGDDEIPTAGAMFWTRMGQPACPHDPPCERHLFAVCPDGWVWDIDARPDGCPAWHQQAHHCWKRHGEPPRVTVSLGDCRMGGGSIATPRGGHWWLVDGEFIEAQPGEAHPADGT